MSNVTRLPVHHPEHPHCDACGKDLPDIQANTRIAISKSGFGDCDVIAVGFDIQCSCGLVTTLKIRTDSDSPASATTRPEVH